jgi:HAD superfamily hydrolase (TIGR01490 family)
MKELDVVFFDMDHTILAIDCDVSWKKFLIDKGMAPAEDSAKAEYYWDLYCQGKSPVEEFVEFQLREFAGRTPEEMCVLTQRHFDERIRQFIYPEAHRVIEEFSAKGVPTVLVTGTNRFLSQPLVDAVGITTLLATEPEIVNGRFTGGIVEPFLLKQGKLLKAREYCQSLQTDLKHAAFFADSINDLEMLASVGTPVVVNPADMLIEEAKARHWRIESWSL